MSSIKTDLRLQEKVLLLQVQEALLLQAACAVLTNGIFILMYSDKDLQSKFTGNMKFPKILLDNNS